MQLLRAVEGHSGLNTEDEPPRCLADQVAEVATLRQNGGSAKPRVGVLISNLEDVLERNRQADALHRATRGDYRHEVSEHICLSLVEGCSPSSLGQKGA